MAIQIQVQVDPELAKIRNEFQKKVDEIYRRNSFELVRQVTTNSPRGATLQLINGWRTRRDVAATIPSIELINRAPDALRRVAGNPPGKFPNISKIRDWAAAKGVPTDRRTVGAISAAIWRRGTKRHQEGADSNVLKAKVENDRIVGYLPNSPVLRTEQRLAREINAIAI